MDSVNELYAMLDNLLVIDVEADTEEEQRAFFIKYNSHFAGIENVVLSEVASGQYDTIMKVCNYIERAKNKTSLIYKAILAKLISFRKIVLSQAIHSDNTELRELAATISKLCEENSSGVTAPLAPE
jgi:GTPase Era involved in 16S rRNA processing